MPDNIQDRWENMDSRKKTIVLAITAAILCLLILCVLVFAFKDGKRQTTDAENEIETSETESFAAGETEMEVLPTESMEETEIPSETQTEEGTRPEEDPQNSTHGNMTSESGVHVDISEVLTNTNETKEITLGIDVAKYQGTIDWKQVADAGVDFAIVRAGYRTLKTGEIIADANAKYNMQEASKYGIKVGVYFFSTAVSVEEAIAEADWVADYISKYQITYPVVYNCEGYENAENRHAQLTMTQRTDFAIAFLNRIANRGYTPMFYASKGEMEGDAKWETSRIQSSYKIWVAQYPSVSYPQTPVSSYSGTHAMWQYTNNGTVPGISKPVDMNVAYFGYENAEAPQNTEAPEVVKADVEALMHFREVNEQVTAKEKTNLRNIPSQGEDASVMYTLSNGEIALRTGISDSGWSRILWNQQIYYAVSSYLTTDLTIRQPESLEVPTDAENNQPPETEEVPSEPEDGIQTQFTQTDEWVTPKDAVNLRTLPSVTNENAQIVVKAANGELLHRTGINNDVGWSRVEYNGQILYCVSSYLMPAEAP